MTKKLPYINRELLAAQCRAMTKELLVKKDGMSFGGAFDFINAECAKVTKTERERRYYMNKVNYFFTLTFDKWPKNWKKHEEEDAILLAAAKEEKLNV